MRFLSLQLSRLRTTAARFIGLVAVLAGGVEARAQADGTERWALRTGVFRATIEATPAVDAEGTLYVAVTSNTTPARGQMFAIRRDGSPKWSAPVVLPDAIDSSPALSADQTELYVGCWDGAVYAFSTATGAQRWRCLTGPRNYVYSSPAVGPDGTIYVGAGDLGDSPEVDSGLYAISREGVLRWKRPAANLVDSSPAVGTDGTIYFASYDAHVYAVAPDGTPRWHFAGDSAIWGSPAIGPDGTIYIGSSAGTLYAISRDGRLKWEYATGGAIYAAPAIGADGAIFVGAADYTLYALEPDKRVRWTKSLGQAILSTPAIRSDGTVIVGGDDRRVHAFAAQDGAELWVSPVSHYIRASPVVADRTIHVAALDGLVYSYHSTSALSAHSSWPMFRGDARHRGRARAPLDSGRLVNLSTRAAVSPNTNLITGFVVRGGITKYYLVRAIGPTLEMFGVTNPLPDPTITVRHQNGVMVHGGFNDNWSDSVEGPSPSATAEALGAFPLPVGSRDAVVVSLLEPGPYTATVGSADGAAGVALVEAYDAVWDTPGAQLVNLSTRGHVAAENGIIPGLVVRGSGPLRLLIRAVGPGLAQFGVPNVLTRPTLSVFSGQTIIRANAGWTADGARGDIAGAAALSGAFPLADNSLDSAALMDLLPGNYTIQVTGANFTSGEVLVEVYVAP